MEINGLVELKATRHAIGGATSGAVTARCHLLGESFTFMALRSDHLEKISILLHENEHDVSE